MPKSIRKRAKAKTVLILLSIFLFLFIFQATASAITRGDVNEDGKINVVDVLLVMQHRLEIIDPPLTEDQLKAADVNGDGDVDIKDVLLIMEYALGIIDEFPLIICEEVDAENDLDANTFVLSAVLSGEPVVEPEDDDFTLTVTIDDEDAPDPDSFDWDEDTLTASWEWPAIQPIATEQEVNFSVSYKDTTPASGSITVEPIVIEVVSVRPVSRTEIDVTLEVNTDPDAAELLANYTVTVGGDDIDVTDASYDTATDIVTLEVDLTGKYGVCIVNEVEADIEVPKVPEFYDINTKAGSKKVVLIFNTAVFDLTGALEPADFTVTTAGEANAVTAVDVAGSKAAARDTITITLEERTMGDTITKVTLTETGAATIVNIFEEPASEAIVQELTPIDTDPPLYTRLRAVDGGYIVYLEFSEDVHTDGEDLSAGVGDTEDVRVRVRGERVNAVGNMIDGFDIDDAKDSIMVKLDLDRDELLASGDTVTARFDERLQDAATNQHIRDLSGNVFDGLRNRTASFIKGPGFTAVVAEDLAKGDSVQQTFSFTLDGKLESGEEVWIDVSDADLNLRNAYAGKTPAVDADMTASAYDAANQRFVLEADADIADGTTVIVTVSGLDTTLVDVVEGVEVFFQRRDYGTNNTDTFSVGSGFSSLSVPSLVSGRDNQTFNGLTFRLEGALADGKKVSIDLSKLAEAGVDFSDVDPAETKSASTNAGNFSFAFSGNVMTLTADAEIGDQTLVTLDFRDNLDEGNIIDVDPYTTGDDYEVTFTRDDALVSTVAYAEIEANIIIDFADDLDNDKANQTQRFRFAVDGAIDSGEEITITITDSKGVKYSDDEVTHYEVVGINADVTSVVTDGSNENPVITIKLNQNIGSGTNIEVKAEDVDAEGVVEKDVEVEIERQDTNNADTFVFRVGEDTGTVTVFTTAGLNAALDNTDIDTIILGGDITLSAAVDVDREVTINLNDGKTLTDAPVASFSVSGDGDDATIKNGILNLTENDFDVMGATYEYIVFTDGTEVSVALGKNPTFNNVRINDGTFIPIRNGTTLTVLGNLMLNNDALSLRIAHNNAIIDGTGTITGGADGEGRVVVNAAGGTIKDVTLDVDVRVNQDATFEGVTITDVTVRILAGRTLTFEEPESTVAENAIIVFLDKESAIAGGDNVNKNLLSEAWARSDADRIILWFAKDIAVGEQITITSTVVNLSGIGAGDVDAPDSAAEVEIVSSAEDELVIVITDALYDSMGRIRIFIQDPGGISVGDDISIIYDGVTAKIKGEN